MENETEVKEIKPDEWEQMSADQLIMQKSIMLDRYEFLARRGYQVPAQMMLEGINKLDSLILNY
jgi:hypothetical protein